MNQPDHNSTAVLLLAHGTPNVLGEMPAYLAKVTGGRALPPSVVAELQHRYAQIGLGETPTPEPPPLTRWTFAQARLLESALAAAGHPLRVYAAMRNWRPFIPDVVAKMRADGVNRILALCLAPQNSSTSTGLYRRALTAASKPKPRRVPPRQSPPSPSSNPGPKNPPSSKPSPSASSTLYPRACAESARRRRPGTRSRIPPRPLHRPLRPLPHHPVQRIQPRPRPLPHRSKAHRRARLRRRRPPSPQSEKMVLRLPEPGRRRGPLDRPHRRRHPRRHPRRRPPRTSSSSPSASSVTTSRSSTTSTSPSPPPRAPSASASTAPKASTAPRCSPRPSSASSSPTLSSCPPATAE